MTTFDPPIYVKPANPKGDVIVFGKAPELELADAVCGVARFGGDWRAPSYFRAYLRAADVLVNHGVQTNTLDDIGLPAFYMQRHALELLVKRLLSWVYEYAQAIGDDAFLTNGKLKAFKTSHNIPKLLDHLRSACSHFGFAEPPNELSSLVTEMVSFEKSETWARYERSESKESGVLQHVKEEVVLPLVAMQQKLEDVAANVLYRFDGTETYEEELYYSWLNVTGNR